ncbi:serpin B7-like [Bicyclus anynana]|uniref:Serpin B7-like n=1 Tax=Bicyclus anynana TaxID=110368 RepID=A0A6J1MGZ1_BICAN|nr:serpin B7-like [Bicyclus anynana]
MLFPVCIGVLFVNNLFASIRAYDFSILGPPIRDVPLHLQMEICFMGNKPFYCPKSQQKSYTANANRYIKDRILLSPKRNRDNFSDRLPLYSPHQLLSSFQYAPSPEIHGSFLRNLPLLEHGKYTYGVTTVTNGMKPSSDYSVLPTRGNAVKSTVVPLFTTVLKPEKEKDIHLNVTLFDKFILSLDQFDRKFYQITFNKLLSISPLDRLENGISFAQSGLFLYLALTALSTELDLISSKEIDSNLQLKPSVSDKIKLIKQIISWLPESSPDLKLHWATRLVVEPVLPVSQEFLEGAATALNIQVEWLNGTETSEELTKNLNRRVKTDSGGAMRNTFEEDDFSEGTCSILLNTVYLRARWRSPPTVLNGSRPFRDSEQLAPGAPERSVRMIRINDVMRYAALKEWNAEALEISYATPGLTLLLLIPRGRTIKSLATNVTTTSLTQISQKLRTMRVAATLPIYTLRMTLLLPDKLQAMGISRLVDANHTKSKRCGQLRLSHAVQRIMFWAEAGRNAYKDDGIEWDETPEKEMIVDRPYLFFVRWKNVTLINGNFAL